MGRNAEGRTVRQNLLDLRADYMSQWKHCYGDRRQEIETKVAEIDARLSAPQTSLSLKVQGTQDDAQ